MPYTPYTNLTPLPVGANTQQWVQASNWNPVVSAATVIHNIVDYGAPNANDPTQDVAPAYYAALAAFNQTTTNPPFSIGGNVSGAIYLPEGRWYTSRPLMVPSDCTVFGDGNNLTVIQSGVGTPSTTSLVQGFSGPVFYMTGLIGSLGSYPWAPTYGAALIGSGQSLVLSPTMPPMFLHDSFPWSWYMGMLIDSTQVSLQCWHKTTASPSANLFAPIIGTRGPDVRSPAPTDVCIGIYLTCDAGGTQFFYKAYLTTQPGWTPGTFSIQGGNQQSITSSAIAANATHNLELDYNGSFFDFYVDGVNQGHLTATGPLCKAPWETASIGPAGVEAEPTTSGPLYVPASGFLDSIRLSNVARHSGVGSFTPPVARYAGDSNTLWLCNWDQGQTPAQGSSFLPFTVAQTAIVTGNFGAGPNTPTLSLGQLMPHYIRLVGGSGIERATIANLQIYCSNNTSGIVLDAASRCECDHVDVIMPAHFGFKSADGGSFYTNNHNCGVWWGADIGIQWYGDTIDANTQACPIGVQVYFGGKMEGHLCQPNYASFAPMLLGSGGSRESIFTIVHSNNDAEVWTFMRQISPLVCIDIFGSIYSQGNIFDAGASTGSPITYMGAPPQYATFTGDYFNLTSSAPARFINNYADYIPAVTTIVNPVGLWNTFPTLPNSTTDNFLALVTPTGSTNTQGLSITDTPANNLAGTFTIQHGFTSGGPVFFTPEPDSRYVVQIAYKSFTGSAPAAGSTTPGPYVTSATGFMMTTGIDPGGTCIVTFSYIMARTFGDPLLLQAAPTIPSNVANPLVPSFQTGPWAAGVTIVPVFNNSFFWNQGLGNQTILNAGTTPNTGNWWELFIAVGGGLGPAYSEGSVAADIDAYVRNGKLVGVLSPGPHNLVMGNVGNAINFYIDGVPIGLQAGTAGTQQTPIYIGQRFNATQGLTVATLRNLKVDPKVSLCITNEQDAGPGAKPQAAFFGDTWTQGIDSTSNNGGFATQICNNRYAAKYYWMACSLNLQMCDTGNFGPGITTKYWTSWGQFQTSLVGVSILGGWYDLLVGPTGGTGNTAANVWAAMLPMLDGRAATATFTPPSAPPLFPWTNGGSQAWAEFVVPTSGTASCVINGINVPVTFVTDDHTTATTLAAAINANGAINTLVTAVAQNNGYLTGFKWNVYITAIAQGALGNGISVSTNGVGGTFWYTGFPSVGATFGGKNVTCVINGTSFVANFDTNANTTVNDLITLIAANAPISALVTPTLVAGTMLITAVTVGSAANSITVTTNGINGAVMNAPTVGPFTLTGGISGARVPNGLASITVCTVPPFGTASGYTAGKDAERVTLNGLIAAYAGAHPGTVHLADVDVTVRNPANHANLLPAYDDGAGFLNNAGHTAVFGLLTGILP